MARRRGSFSGSLRPFGGGSLSLDDQYMIGAPPVVTPPAPPVTPGPVVTPPTTTPPVRPTKPRRRQEAARPQAGDPRPEARGGGQTHRPAPSGQARSGQAGGQEARPGQGCRQGARPQGDDAEVDRPSPGAEAEDPAAAQDAYDQAPRR